MHEGLRLQYLPHENEELKDLVDDLLIHIRNAPCLVAHLLVGSIERGEHRKGEG
jgi:hypothetical protein